MLFAIFASYFPLQKHAAIVAARRLSRLRGRSAHTASSCLRTKSLSVNHSKKLRKNYKCTSNCETSVSAVVMDHDVGSVTAEGDGEGAAEVVSRDGYEGNLPGKFLVASAALEIAGAENGRFSIEGHLNGKRRCRRVLLALYYRLRGLRALFTRLGFSSLVALAKGGQVLFAKSGVDLSACLQAQIG